MSVVYNYSLSGDFTFGAKAQQLHNEILVEAGITTTLDGIYIDEDAETVDIYFAVAISPAEETLLNGIVASHTPSNDIEVSFSEGQILVSVDDTTAGFLEDKVNLDSILETTTSNPGGNEVFNLSVNEGNITHQNLSGAGTNTHAQIDSHIASTSNPHNVLATQITDFSTEVDARITLQKGAVNGLATLNGFGQIPDAQLPPLAITDTFVVTSQAAQTSLVAETGDVAIRTDESQTYILRGSDPSIFGNWEVLQTPAAPVLSVNSQTGTVLLDSDDIPEGSVNLYYTEARVSANVDVAANTAARDKFKISANDTTAGLFLDKVNSDSSLTITENTDGGNETVTFSVNAGNINHQDLNGAGTNTHAQIDSHIADTSIHFVIDDGSTTTTTAWSSSKIASEISAASGETNTASNVNVGGVGVFKQKTGVNLEFYGINAASNRISVVLDGPNNEIDLDVNQANLTLTASQISDFDTEVSNNTDVAANTAARSQVRVTSNDTTDGYLLNKLVAGNRISFTENNDGANETLTIATDAEANQASNVGTGVGVYKTKSLETLQFRSIAPASSLISVALSGTSNEVEIEVNQGNLSLTASQISDFDAEVANNTTVTANTAARFLSKVSSNDTTGDYLINKIVAGTNITVTEINNGGNETIEISAAGSVGEANTASNVNTAGVGVFKQKTGIDLEFFGINNASNLMSVTLDIANNEIDLDVNQANLSLTASQISDFDTEVSNNTDVAANTAGRFLSKVSSNDTTGDYLLNKIVAGTNITITEINNGGNETLEISASGSVGEANTASNVNVGGVGVFKQKTGIDLEFYGINAASNKISVLLDGPNNEIDLDVVETNIPHQNLSGAATYTHAQIDTHINDSTLHRVINDASSSLTELLSSSEIDSRIATAPYETNTASNINVGGLGVFDQKIGVDLQFRGIDAGSSKVTTTLDAVNNKINVDIVEGNIIHQNLNGAGTNTHAQIDSHIADVTIHRTINDASSTTTELLSSAEIDSRITAAAGEVNTASNVNTTGIGVFKQKTGVNFEFRGIVAASSKISAILDDPNNEIELDVVEGNIVHQNLSGAGTNTHAQIDSHIASTANPHNVLATQISDFDTEVSNNTDVSANTAARFLSKATLNDTTGGYLLDKLDAGSNISLTLVNAGGDESIQISTSGPLGEINTASNVNVGGVGVFKQKTASNLEFFGINAASNRVSVVLDSPNSEIDIDVNQANLVLTASQISDFDTEVSNNTDVAANTAGRFLSKVSSNDTTGDFLASKIVAGSNINVTQLNDGSFETLEIAFSGSLGEVNTASNINVGGIGVFDQKSGVDLQFRGINAASTKLSATLDATNNKIDLDVVEANIVHQNLSGAGTNTHAQIDSHIADSSIHFTINDGSSNTTNVLSSSEVDSRITAAQLGFFNYKGSWDANTNSPSLSSGTGTAGDWYRVTTAGTTNLDGITDWQVGDDAYFDGTVWRKVDNTDQVLSVNGQQGAVVLDTDDISEGITNLWYTEARVSANVDVAANTAARNQVLVSANDTTDGYLSTKIVAGTNITITELNDGGNETLEIAASGGGSLSTGNIAWVDAVYGNDGTGAVGNANLPYLTIKAAHDSITSGQIVIVRPGSYSETPFTVGTGKSIIAQDGPERTTFDSTTATGNRLTLSGDCVVQGFRFVCPTDTTYAINFTGTGECKLKHIELQGSGALGSGINCTGTGRLEIDGLTFASGTVDNMISVSNGEVHLHRADVHEGTITDCIDISGGTFRIDGLSVDNLNTTNGIHSSGGEFFGSSIFLQGCTNGIRVSANNTSMEIRATRVEASTYDLLIDSGLTTATLHFIGCEMQEERFSIPSTWLFDDTVFSFQDEKVGDRPHKHWGELNVGTAEKGFESVFGEGDSYIRGMVVLTTDSTATSTTDGGNLTDVSSSAASALGSTFTFQGTTANHTILIGSSLYLAGGSDRLKHWGIKISQTIGSVEATAKSFVFERWNGTSWEAFNVMATHSSLYHRYANDLFLRSSSSEHIRYGLKESSSWAKKTINSQELYWVRIRITTTVTTAPVFEQFKLSTSRFEANADGTNTYHGLSRFRQTLLATGNLFGEAGGVTDASVDVGTGGVPTGWQHTLKNSLLNGNGDYVTFQTFLPKGIDTSLPIEIKLLYQIGGTNNSGNGTIIISALPVEIVGNLVADPAGGIDPVSRSAANTEALQGKVAQVFNSPINLDGSGGNNDKIFQITWDSVTIADYYEGDALILRVELDEDGTPNTDLILWGIEINGVAWTHGERI